MSKPTRLIRCLFIGAVCSSIPAWAVTLNTPFTLESGDRVVFIGTTFLEREGRYGWIETGLTAAYPEADVTFRNLGWSGDTVFGDARSYFGPPEEGFQRLAKLIDELKPTVAFLHYGQNAAFEGESGLGEFLRGFNRLLDLFGPYGTRLVFISPMRQEPRVSPVRNLQSINAQVDLYSDAVEELCGERGGVYLDVRNLLETGPWPMTDNGIHLTAEGYRTAAGRILSELGVPSSACSVQVDVAAGSSHAMGAELSEIESQTGAVAFTLTSPRLPLPGRSSDSGCSLRITGLPDGPYTVSVDGGFVKQSNASELAAGVTIASGPEFDRLDALRTAILEKTTLYFHRWRPQNETYIFGFRKHEQGQNAVEIPMFDPLVAEVETRISELRKPTPHRYQIQRNTEN